MWYKLNQTDKHIHIFIYEAQFCWLDWFQVLERQIYMFISPHILYGKM